MQQDYVSATVMVPIEISVPTVGPCPGGCGGLIVTRKNWAAIKPEIRKQLYRQFRVERARKTCRLCYDRLQAVGDHVDLPPRQMHGYIFVDEYIAMHEAGMTDYSIRDSLGMTKSAFRQALWRARKAGKL